ncbi:MAG: peptidylprolyl isomerase [Planctomycetota bacterium]
MPARICLLATALLLAGCSSSPDTRSADTDRTPQRLDVADFADADATAPRREAPAPAEPERATPTRLTTSIGSPSIPTTGVDPSGERLVIDRVVGQINGKPIFAQEFYRASARRWIEESKTLPVREWSTNLREFTERELYRRVREELLLAEFRASLSEPQRQGVLAFVEGIRTGIVDEFGGSEQRANRSFLDDQGITLDEAIRNRAEREFIFQQLRGTISNRVQVSSRDIELYYNRNIDEYQPQPVATLRQAFAPADNQERIDELATLFASDSPLPENLGVVRNVTLDRGGDTRFFAPDELNDAAASLRPGEHAGPVAMGSSVWFIRYESRTQDEQRSLYDAQLEIEETLRQERLIEEEAKYFERLLARSNVSTINTMIAKLLDYAIERLYQPEEDGGGGG